MNREPILPLIDMSVFEETDEEVLAKLRRQLDETWVRHVETARLYMVLAANYERMKLYVQEQKEETVAPASAKGKARPKAHRPPPRR